VYVLASAQANESPHSGEHYNVPASGLSPFVPVFSACRPRQCSVQHSLEQTLKKMLFLADHYGMEGLEKLESNAKVCTEVGAERFMDLFVSRI